MPFNAFSAALLAGVMSVGFSTGASSETIEGALARAYGSNPNLNANRAGTRAVDESVPQALSGYRPKLAASGDTGYASQDTLIGGNTSNDKYFPRGVGVQLDQTIWNGNRTGNSVRRADRACCALASNCDRPSNQSCSTRPRPTWMCCATPRS